MFATYKMFRRAFGMNAIRAFLATLILNRKGASIHDYDVQVTAHIVGDYADDVVPVYVRAFIQTRRK